MIKLIFHLNGWFLNVLNILKCDEIVSNFNAHTFPEYELGGKNKDVCLFQV